MNNICQLFLGHNFCMLSLSDLYSDVDKMTFQEMYQFHTFYPKILGWRSLNLQIEVLIFYRCY